MNPIVIEKKPFPIPKTKQVSMKSYWLGTGEMRLDASFYTAEATTANRILKEIGYPLLDLGELTDRVFYPPRAKRYYTNKAEGTPYLTSSKTLWFLRDPYYVIANKLPNIDDWYVNAGWTLLTRSGTVGLLILASKELEKYVLSEHMIRIVPKTDTLSGYLYAYLQSWFGQTYITKRIFGGVVEQIEPHHVQTIPVPLLPKEIQKLVHDNMIKVSGMREKARQLVKDAEKLMHQELGLPKLELNQNKRAFSIASSELDLRFDASYHDPNLRDVENAIENAEFSSKRLGDAEVSERIFIPNRFKRTYVQEPFGVPFLSGTNILQTKPHNLKFLSRGTRNLERYLLKAGMILIAARGTIGRIMPVTKSTSGWAASDNIARVIPSKANYGYLTCFLNSIFGQCQLIGQTAGSVVNLIQPKHIGEVQVPIPPISIQKAIGDLVIEAYELKEFSNRIEDETVETLENMLSDHQKTEVNEKYLNELNSYADSFDLVANDEFRRDNEDFEDTTSLSGFRKEHGL